MYGDDFLLYVDDGASVFAALVKKGTNEVNTNKINKGLYGIGDGQSVLPQHQYLQNELTFPEGDASTDEIAAQAQKVLDKAIVGDEQAISEITDAFLLPSYRREASQKLLAKVIDTVDNNMASNAILSKVEKKYCELIQCVTIIGAVRIVVSELASLSSFHS